MTPAELRSLRRQLGLSQTELARRIGRCLRWVQAAESDTSLRSHRRIDETTAIAIRAVAAQAAAEPEQR